MVLRERAPNHQGGLQRSLWASVGASGKRSCERAQLPCRGPAQRPAQAPLTLLQLPPGSPCRHC